MAYLTQEAYLQQYIDRMRAGPLWDTMPHMTHYMRCPECSASFEWLIIGGRGDHRQTITCEKCFHIQKNLNYTNIIIPLTALYWGFSLEEAEEKMEAREREYRAALARQAGF